VLFVLFALTGVSPSATQKPKITQKSITVRCAAVLPEQKSVQAMKSPQAILCVLARALKQHGRFSARQNRVCPCQLMVIIQAKAELKAASGNCEHFLNITGQKRKMRQTARRDACARKEKRV